MRKTEARKRNRRHEKLYVTGLRRGVKKLKDKKVKLAKKLAKQAQQPK